MTDNTDCDGPASWIDPRRPPDFDPMRASRVEVLQEDNSEAMTFVSQRPGDDDGSTAWITIDAESVVDVTEMH